MAVDAWGKPIYDPSQGADQWGRQTGNAPSVDAWGRPVFQSEQRQVERLGGMNDFSRPQFYNSAPSALQRNQGLTNNREDSIANFVARMQRPQDTAMNSQLAGDVGKYGGGVDSFLSSAAPVADKATLQTGNRFETGVNDATTRLQSLLDNPDSINKSAAYQFRVGQGQEALQRSLGAKGLLNSGNRLAELTKYGQDMGSQEYGAQFDRLKGVLDTNVTGYGADRTANNTQFAAESTANNNRFQTQSDNYNKRGSTLADLYKTAGTAYNQNTQVGGDDRTKWGAVWNGQSPKDKPQYGLPSYGWPT